MIQKFRENVEISNKVNFRDYSKDFVILRPRVVLFCPLTQHDHDRIAVLFCSFSSALALLPACWRLQYKKRESVYTKDRVGIRSVDMDVFFFFF